MRRKGGVQHLARRYRVAQRLEHLLRMAGLRDHKRVPGLRFFQRMQNRQAVQMVRVGHPVQDPHQFGIRLERRQQRDLRNLATPYQDETAESLPLPVEEERPILPPRHAEEGQRRIEILRDEAALLLEPFRRDVVGPALVGGGLGLHQALAHSPLEQRVDHPHRYREALGERRLRDHLPPLQGGKELDLGLESGFVSHLGRR